MAFISIYSIITAIILLIYNYFLSKNIKQIITSNTKHEENLIIKLNAIYHKLMNQILQ
jgi:hypothetical protein